MYRFLRFFFFLLPAETAHNLVFFLIKSFFKVPGVAYFYEKSFRITHPALVRTVFGKQLKNPVGLAAGLDKDASLINELFSMGFGFIEIGTLTPKAQPGNPRPRLFRLKKDKAFINRMGFNNHGVEDAVKRLKKVRPDVVVGGNIGKNKLTPNELAYQDYLKAFRVLFPYVDYFVVNVSSPNTPGLRELQDKKPLSFILKSLQEFNAKQVAPKPILLKISPDMTEPQLDDILEIIEETNLDGIVATNTTIGRAGLKSARKKVENIGAGGLSGAPLVHLSTKVIKYLKTKKPSLFIIGVGGILTPEDALDKIKAGADLVQLYTGFVYQGPDLIKEINKALIRHNF